MIVFDPLTFKEMMIDETQLTEEQAEYFRTLNKLHRRILNLIRQRDLIWLKLMAESGMGVRDYVKKLEVR